VLLIIGLDAINLSIKQKIIEQKKIFQQPTAKYSTRRNGTRAQRKWKVLAKNTS
jgi:hypothetical protein